MRRVVIAGTHSGGGKTTVALALMRALRDRGQTVAPFKVGPDYIDPGFHRFVCGRSSHNLDAHLMDDIAIAQTLTLGAQGADIAVIEGVMGYYDGIGVEFAGSTYDMARRTGTPALLVVDAAGSATSAAAVVLGFLRMAEPSGIAGVLVNRAGSEGHYQLVREAVLKYTGLSCVGWLKKDSSIALGSRHLGLIPAEELSELEERARQTAALLTMDWPTFDHIAASAPPVAEHPMPILPDLRGYRLGIARDEAFSFYYEANLELLRGSGVELIPFSPLREEALPEKLDGLYLGGGFPEVFAEQLSANLSMRASIRSALENGLACYAECGGMIYLTESIDGHAMVGFLPMRSEMTKKLQRFGYVWVEDKNGARYPGHEFHHSVIVGGDQYPTEYEVIKASAPDRRWRGGYRRKNTLAGYPHLHFLSHPELVRMLFSI